MEFYKTMKYHSDKKYYLIYKPFRVLSQFTPVEGKQCLGGIYKFENDVYSVGRLDYDSEGLLMLTNDARLKTLIQEPANNIEKQYLVQVEGVFSQQAAAQIRSGIEIRLDSGIYRTKPCKVEVHKDEPVLPERNPPVRFRQSVPTTWLKITLSEGKNRQIRKMTAKAGFPTLRIVRTAIGHLTLGGLLPGEFRELTKNEIGAFFRS